MPLHYVNYGPTHRRQRRPHQQIPASPPSSFASECCGFSRSFVEHAEMFERIRGSYDRDPFDFP